ncbi:hypothetical protein J2X65_005415 [Ancylobacter sp. 3268]|uniref:hypothetical protein n=1 Tax=Ancylobacter sp. 3268 TaxID=2817752 RepID=UPI002862992F|nr:hypothetical protein [Ancylobacter sp. 3268]MDR6956021.1 hypothetical protein [Ancylobacter sp. 3268]
MSNLYPEIEPKRPGESHEAFYERYNKEFSRLRGWPPHIRPLNLAQLEILGIDERTGQLYWDGAPVVTRHELGRREFFLAALVAWATVVAALATVASAIADYIGLAHPS